MSKILVLCAILLTPLLPDKARAPVPAPQPAVRNETVTGCPACCCDVKVPAHATNERAMELCMASGDKACMKMCKEWMRARGLHLPKTQKTHP